MPPLTEAVPVKPAAFLRTTDCVPTARLPVTVAPSSVPPAGEMAPLAIVPPVMVPFRE